MKLLCFTPVLAAFLLMQANAVAQLQVRLQSRGAYVAVDLNSAEVLIQPVNGSLENSSEGIVYVPDTVGGDDSFVFVADHSDFGVPVFFHGEVVAGDLALTYGYTKEKEHGNSSGGSGAPGDTVTVNDDSGTIVTGTVYQGPDTSIDFPDGTVVIGTDDSVANDTGIIDEVEEDEIHIHDNVASIDELVDILQGYPDGSIPDIVLVGHGSGGGVSTQNGDDLDGQDITNGNHQDLIDLLNDKLSPDAHIYILGCDQFDEDDAQHVQDLADATGHPVVANEDPVWWVTSSGNDTWYGDGNWIEVLPTTTPPTTTPPVP